ncbi:ribbon-helix-helix domain-containing protein [Longimicrobium sp.]|uniref:ribbon-helix-helix domain-containing protein n=1 Tax=Longimicrobium sp. TaxID=2029185 RepID=UPI002E318AB7|nr:ribbon-helix-helix domain-containing protein [Longimicrobium sp.]HEX6038065.1 ribbon-helix-helix domain-containing protein [Longimicrobium sp.]
MAAILKVRLDDKLADALDRVCALTGTSREVIVQDALRRSIRQTNFDACRARLMPYAEAVGWHTDEDVFRRVS